MHTKQFDIAGWLRSKGLIKVKYEGRTPHGGFYKCGDRTPDVHFRLGMGGVSADIDGERFLVEAKGGCVNWRHSGLLSQLRTRSYEAVGSRFDPLEITARLVAAVPRHSETEKLAYRIVARCRKAAIEIALVSPNGEVWFLPA